MQLRRNLLAMGNSNSANENGARRPTMPPAGCVTDEACGNWMVSVTMVVPEPAGTLFGEKIAVAPAGRPLADRAMALGKTAAPFAGLMVKVIPAVPPACRVPFTAEAVSAKSASVTLPEIHSLTSTAPSTEPQPRGLVIRLAAGRETHHTWNAVIAGRRRMKWIALR